MSGLSSVFLRADKEDRETDGGAVVETVSPGGTSEGVWASFGSYSDSGCQEMHAMRAFCGCGQLSAWAVALGGAGASFLAFRAILGEHSADLVICIFQ